MCFGLGKREECTCHGWECETDGSRETGASLVCRNGSHLLIDILLLAFSHKNVRWACVCRPISSDVDDSQQMLALTDEYLCMVKLPAQGTPSKESLDKKDCSMSVISLKCSDGLC